MSFVCVYILKKQNKKKFKISKIFPKKEKNFQKNKNLWTRDIGLPSDFFKKDPKKEKKPARLKTQKGSLGKS